MKVIILAAGRGSRLGNLTKEKPKCMCMLGGKTLLERCIDNLERAGILRQHIGIVTGYKQEQINIDGATKFYNEDWENTNMFVSLTKAKKWLESESCIVCYSDIVFSPNVIKKTIERTAPLSIPYYTGYWELWSARMDNPLEDLETFIVDNNKLIEIGLKPESRDSVEGQFMGIIRFTPEGWSQAMDTIKYPMPKTIEKLDMTTLLNCMIKKGYAIETFPSDTLWLECDTENDIHIYEEMLSNGKISL